MKFVFILLLVLLASYFAGQQLRPGGFSNKEEIYISSNCDPSISVCKVNAGPYNYRIKFAEQPSALKSFKVQLKIKDPQPQAVLLVFDMQGMDMGYSEFPMRYGSALWQARVILPVCSLGRNDWRLKVKLVSEKTVYETAFNFRQVKL